MSSVFLPWPTASVVCLAAFAALSAAIFACFSAFLSALLDCSGGWSAMVGLLCGALVCRVVEVVGGCRGFWPRGLSHTEEGRKEMRPVRSYQYSVRGQSVAEARLRTALGSTAVNLCPSFHLEINAGVYHSEGYKLQWGKGPPVLAASANDYGRGTDLEEL